MFVRSRLRWCRAFGALMFTVLSAGCVAYPADPGYRYSGGPYYGSGVVVFGDGGHDRWYYGHHDWDDGLHHGRHDWDDHHDGHRRT